MRYMVVNEDDEVLSIESSMKDALEYISDNSDNFTVGDAESMRIYEVASSHDVVVRLSASGCKAPCYVVDDGEREDDPYDDVQSALYSILYNNSASVLDVLDVYELEEERTGDQYEVEWELRSELNERYNTQPEPKEDDAPVNEIRFE